MKLQELRENRSCEPVVLRHGFAASAFSGRVRTGWSCTLEGAGFRRPGVALPGHGPNGGPVDVLTARAVRQGTVEFLGRSAGPGILP